MERGSLPPWDSVTPYAVIMAPKRGELGRSARRGFTLVELMIVVAIVGVLAILAVVGFSKLIGSSRTTEAIGTVNAIKVAQEAYHAETGTYANLSSTLCTTTSCSSLYPTIPAGKSAVGDYKVGWGVACGSACQTGMDWSMLPVHISGGVMYGYSTTAGFAGTSVTPSPITLPNGPSSTYTVTFPAVAPSDWFLVTGVGDENMDGIPCVVLGTSFTNDLQVANEGE